MFSKLGNAFEISKIAKEDYPELKGIEVIQTETVLRVKIGIKIIKINSCLYLWINQLAS